MNNNIDEINQYLSSVTAAAGNLPKEKIAELAAMILKAYEEEKTIFVFGNGGSGANASHFAGDLIKGASYGLEKRFKAVCLNDNLSALMAVANDISYEEIFVEQLKNFVKEGDVVIGISGSGNSMNVVKALEYGLSVGAQTVAICGFNGGKIKEIADLVVHVAIDDMEVSEDLHLVILHCVKRVIMQALPYPPS